MILPYPIDLFLEYIGITCQHIAGWSPEGKRVRIKFDDGNDSLIHGVYEGTIELVKTKIVTRGSCGVSDLIGQFPVIKLSNSLSFHKQEISYLIALNKYVGHKLPRLLITSAMVNIHPLRNANDSSEVDFSTRIGSANLSLMPEQK